MVFGSRPPIQKIGKRDAVKIVSDHIVKLCPHRTRSALTALRTGLRSAFKAGNGRKIALGQAEDLANLIFLGLTGQAITAPLAMNALDDRVLCQHGQDALQIFERDLLSFGNFFIAI